MEDENMFIVRSDGMDLIDEGDYTYNYLPFIDNGNSHP